MNNKKFLVLIFLLAIISLVFTSLIFAKVLSIKYLFVSFLTVAILQICLGLFQKKHGMKYKSCFIIAGVLIASGICFLFL